MQPPPFPEFCQENGLAFRITHRLNIARILKGGAPCQSLADPSEPFVNIGNADLISKRTRRQVDAPPWGVLADYVPFYFTPRSMMLFNILTGYNVPRQNGQDIIILVTSIPHLVARSKTFVFTTGHAYMQESSFYNDPRKLDQIDWKILQNSDFRRTDSDPGKSNRYQAELLVHEHLNVDDLLGFACYDPTVKASLEEAVLTAGRDHKVLVKRNWYPR